MGCARRGQQPDIDSHQAFPVLSAARASRKDRWQRYGPQAVCELHGFRASVGEQRHAAAWGLLQKGPKRREIAVVPARRCLDLDGNGIAARLDDEIHLMVSTCAVWSAARRKRLRNESDMLS